ncbi:MAG: NUDIX hydrolase [Myxococcales bacterium]|nr:NUDIX hydrolase [Myxococcales bacterium]
MNYCSHCGATVTHKVPAGDNLPRHVCDRCERVHYHNPKIVAGCIPEWEGQVLLCRRAIEPRLGLWTFPAGFMELGESTEQAAVRAPDLVHPGLGGLQGQGLASAGARGRERSRQGGHAREKSTTMSRIGDRHLGTSW